MSRKETTIYYILSNTEAIIQDNSPVCEMIIDPSLVFDSALKARNYFYENIQKYEYIYGKDISKKALIVKKQTILETIGGMNDFKYVIKTKDFIDLYASKTKITKSSGEIEEFPYFTPILDIAIENVSFDTIDNAILWINTHKHLLRKYYKEEIINSLTPVLCFNGEEM